MLSAEGTGLWEAAPGHCGGHAGMQCACPQPAGGHLLLSVSKADPEPFC